MPLWRPGLTQLPSLLRELISLLREQNSLQRELIQFHTRRAAKTPPAPESQPLTPPRPTRRYTADDVFVASRDNRERQILVEQASQQLPWRHPMETLSDLHPDHRSAAAPAPTPPTSDPTKA